jgi:hypothetical protein
VAPIWLLSGNAGAVMVRNRDGTATTAFLFHRANGFSEK